MISGNHISNLRKCKASDKNAFPILCQENYDYVYRIAFRIVAQEEDVKDIVEET